MLSRATILRASKPRAMVANIPPPVKGWNTRDALSEMDPQYAVILDNYFPEATYCSLRRGYASHATGLGSNVETLMTWQGPAGGKMFGAVQTAIYNVTAAGAVGAADVSSPTNGRWQAVNFTTSGGHFLVACNGADSLRNYDGTSWSTPSITGISSATIINLASHKNRLWFVEADSTKAWYLATSAISGAATSFELGSVFRLGGKLKLIGTLSHDAGDGADDYILFISSLGEIAVYQGTDPSSADTWGLVGTFRVGAPVGERALVPVAGDIGLISEDGIVSVARMLQLDRAAARSASITDSIAPTFAQSFRDYGSLFGWQAAVYPRNHQAIFNIPISTTQAHQYVMNTQTGAWCRFKAQNAFCWGLLNEDLYFGANGTVYKADFGAVDVAASISGTVKPAFNYLSARGTLKHPKMIRPNLSANGYPGVQIRLNVDFEDVAPSTNDIFPTAESSGSGIWGTSLWGTGTWAGSDEVFQRWLSASSKPGYALTPYMVTQTTGMQIKLNGFDLMYEKQQRLAA